MFRSPRYSQLRRRRTHDRSPQARAESGFTIMELLVVVIIIGVVAALAAPTIGTALANRRTNELALDVVRMVRHARSSSMGHGVAHVLSFTDGHLEVWRGENNRCNGNDWATLLSADCGATSRCTDYLDPDAISSSSTYTAAISNGITFLCFEPTGQMYWSDSTTAAFSNLNTVGGALTVTVERSFGGATQGVSKQVIIPFGGDARVRR